MRDLFFVAFLFCAIYYTFKRPYLGVCAWVWIALFAPSEWAFGFSQSFRLNLTIVIFTLCAYVLWANKPKLQFSTLYFLVVCFWLWALLSSFLHIHLDSDVVSFRMIEFTKVFLLFIFVHLTIRTKNQVDTFIWAIVLAVSAYAGMEAVKYILSGGSHRISGRAGIIADRNDLAVAINMCIPLVIYLIQVTRHKLLRLGLWVLLLLNILSIVGTFSRGGFVGLSVLAVAFWLKSDHKLIWALAAVIMLPLLYANAPEDWQERQSTVTTAAEEDSSFIGRIWAWKISTMIAIDHPVTGGGFRAVIEPNVWNYYAPFTPDFGPVYTRPIPESVKPKAAHNIYFQVLGDHGFVGLFIFLLMLLMALLNNMKNARLGKRYGVLWYQHLADAMTLSLVGYGITGMNVGLAYFDLIYAVIGLVVVMNVLRPGIISRSDWPPIQKAASAQFVPSLRIASADL